MADAVSVTLPWGTLLDAMLGRRDDVLCAVAALARPAATLRAIVSITERDGHGAPPDLVALRASYDRAGFSDIAIRPATEADVRDARSSWGKRLGVGRARPALVLTAARR